MVDALSSAANGLLNAQRRATDLAVEILKTTSDQSSFQEETEAATEQQDTDTQSNDPDTRQEQGRPLAQQIVDLKGAEAQFKASAAAFTRVAESQDQLLGSLFDDES